MRFFICILGCAVFVLPAWGKLASVGLVNAQVDSATSTKVDTAQTANQTMAGTYTVSGTLVVPTPPLPSAE